MRIVGFSFVRNALTLDYPVRESLRSMIPLCDEIIVAVGNSSDDTRNIVQSLSEKIKIIDTVWDDTKRSGGSILAEQTTIALSHVKNADWALYLQADEVLHEKDYDAIRSSCERYCSDQRIEGLLFYYYHFYATHAHLATARNWYRKEIRIVRPGIGVTSWGDAQGFRIGGRKLRVASIPAHIYHYGWVRPPQAQARKQASMHSLYHDDAWLKGNVRNEFHYENTERLVAFAGSHPAVMHERIERSREWENTISIGPFVERSFKRRIAHWIEKKTGWRIGEYKNYKL